MKESSGRRRAACPPDERFHRDAPIDADWTETLSRTPLTGDGENKFAVAQPTRRVTHLRLNIFPDGGVARLRVYGRVVPHWARLRASGNAIDLAAVEHGGLVVA